MEPGVKVPWRSTWSGPFVLKFKKEKDVYFWGGADLQGMEVILGLQRMVTRSKSGHSPEIWRMSVGRIEWLTLKNYNSLHPMGVVLNMLNPDRVTFPPSRSQGGRQAAAQGYLLGCRGPVITASL